MRSRAHVFSHPIHPMLIVLPSAVFPLMLLLDLVQASTGTEELARATFWLAIAGVAGTLAAMIPGIIDAAHIPDGTKAHRTMAIHAVLGTLTLIAYAGAVVLRWPYGSVPSVGAMIGLDVLGSLLITAQGWFGGELVYKHHLAVATREEGAEPTPFEGKDLSSGRDTLPGSPRV